MFRSNVVDLPEAGGGVGYAFCLLVLVYVGAPRATLFGQSGVVLYVCFFILVDFLWG